METSRLFQALSLLLALTAVCVPHSAATPVHSVHAIDAPVRDIQYLGRDNVYETILVLSQGRQLYRSSDEGKSWQNRNHDLEGADQNQPHGRGTGVYSLHPSPLDHNRVVVVGVGNRHWHTEDGGETFAVLGSEIDIREVQFHPTEKDWFLVSAKTPKCYHQDLEGHCSLEVFVTLDFGKTFKHLSRNVVQFGWGLPSQPKETVLMTAYADHTKNPAFNQMFDIWDAEVDFIMTTNWMESFEIVLKHGNSFSLDGEFLFVSVVVNEFGHDRVHLEVSANHGRTFSRVHVPGEQTGFTIVDASHGTAFLHVNHGEYERLYGHLYVSDNSGANYTLSLRYQKRDTDGRTDFIKMEGLEGIYLANTVENYDDDMSMQPPRLQTVITFDKGSIWKPLEAPRFDANGDRVHCDHQSTCRLNLHGVTNYQNMGPMYSTESAIGLVIGTGYVGEYLDPEDYVESNTYMSRDAGLTWTEIHKGPHIYEMGDHGSIIVMAPTNALTKKMKYSIDEGATWHTFDFQASHMHVTNIVNNPTSTSKNFLAYGTSEGQGVLIHMDFGSGLKLPECRGADAPDTPDSDFESWSAHSHEGSKCLMGRQVTYVRRKQSSQCFNGNNLERSSTPTHCECTEEDYECDYGYQRTHMGAPCTLISEDYESPMQGEDYCKKGHHYYHTPNGYRLIGGDSCVGGVDHKPPRHKCHWFGGHVSNRAGFVLFILLLVIGGLVGSQMYSRSGNVKGFVDSTFGRMPGMGGGAKNYGYSVVGKRDVESLVDEEYGLDLTVDDDDMDAVLSHDALPAEAAAPADLAPPAEANNVLVDVLTGDAPAAADDGDDFDPRS